MNEKILKRHMPRENFKILDSEHAYWLGFIAADGHMRPILPNKGGRLYIEVSVRDEEHLDKLYTLLGFGGKCYRHRNVVSTVIYQYGSDKLIENISQYINTGNKTELDNFSRVPHEYKKDFIRGYFDGDGHVHASGGMKFTGCKATLDKIAEYLSDEFNIQYSRKVHNGTKAFDYWYIKRDRAIFKDNINGFPRLERKWNK